MNWSNILEFNIKKKKKQYEHEKPRKNLSSSCQDLGKDVISFPRSWQDLDKFLRGLSCLYCFFFFWMLNSKTFDQFIENMF